MRVLVVDDERRLASSLRVGLEAEGLAVDVAHDGTGNDADELDDPDDLDWQVSDHGAGVRSSQPLSRPLPTEATDAASLPGAVHDYVVGTQQGGPYVVSVAVSLEAVDDSTSPW